MSVKKMTNEMIEHIAKMRLHGIKVREISESIGIHETTISHSARKINEAMRRISPEKAPEEKPIIDPFEQYVNSIEKHLDLHGNTIITEKRLKEHSLDEVMEALKRDGYVIKELREPRYHYEANGVCDYWIIEGRKK